MPTKTFIAFLLWRLLAVAAQQPPPPLPQKSVCVLNLVAFSPCLPYVSAPPNNTTNIVDPQCCNAFSSAFESDDGHCFCYLLRLPSMFGFPLNKSRLDSLSSFCMAKNGTTSLDSLCSSGQPALPPLPSTTESGTSPPASPPSTTESGTLKPNNSGSDYDSSAFIDSSPDSPPTPPSSSVEQDISSATNQIYKHRTWFLLGMMIFLLNSIRF